MPERPARRPVRLNGSDLARRFAVYRNNVIVSLVAALADTFPVLRQLVGDEFFDAMAGFTCARIRPSPVPGALHGEGLADWLAAFEPARAFVFTWSDMARLERARIGWPVTPPMHCRSRPKPSPRGWSIWLLPGARPTLRRRAACCARPSSTHAL